MKAGEGILVAAAGAAAVSFGAGATSFIITLVAGAHPPVSPYLTSAQNAEVASSWGGDWIIGLMAMAVAGLTLVQVVVRRPVWSGEAYQRMLPLAGWKLRWSLGVAALAVAFFAWRITRDIGRLGSGSSLSDGWSLYFLGSSLGTFSLFMMILSSWLFVWFLDRSGWRHDPAEDLRLSWRLGRAVRAFAGR